MPRNLSTRPQTLRFRDVASDWAKAGIARKYAEPPDTKEQRAAKQALIEAWMKKHKPKRLPPGFASMVGFSGINFGNGNNA